MEQMGGMQEFYSHYSQGYHQPLREIERQTRCSCYRCSCNYPNFHFYRGCGCPVYFPPPLHEKDAYKKINLPYAPYERKYGTSAILVLPVDTTKLSPTDCQLCEDERNMRLMQCWKFMKKYRLGSRNATTERQTISRSSSSFIHEENDMIADNLIKGSVEKPQRKKRFQCLYCEKSFAKSSHLRDHHRTHSGERPFVCTFCSKAFSQFSNLRTHLRIHTGEKPFKCNVCHKAFTQRVTLRSHARTHNAP